MTEKQIEDLREQFAEAFEDWRSKSPEEKLKRLKAIGILDEDGHLSAKYGGKKTQNEQTEAAAG